MNSPFSSLLESDFAISKSDEWVIKVLGDRHRSGRRRVQLGMRLPWLNRIVGF